jgi:DNA-binding transcriptional MerR regulator
MAMMRPNGPACRPGPFATSEAILCHEEIGLIRPQRVDIGYRDHSGDDIHRLTFPRRAHNLGFSIEDCHQLMALYRDRPRRIEVHPRPSTHTVTCSGMPGRHRRRPAIAHKGDYLVDKPKGE